MQDEERGLRLRRLIAFVVLSTLLSSVILHFSPVVSAGSLTDDFDYYKVITVSDKIDDYTTKVLVAKADNGPGDVDCEGHCNDNFSDIRFSDHLNKSIPYYLENYTSGVQATFWVKNINNSDSLRLFYCDNSSGPFGSTESGSDTFDWYGDFENSLDSGWETGDEGSGTITYSGSVYKHGSYSINLYGADASNQVFLFYNDTATYDSGDDVHVRYWVQCNHTSTDEEWFQTRDDTDSLRWGIDLFAVNTDISVKDDTTNREVYDGFSADTWYVIDHFYNSTDDTYMVYVNNEADGDGAYEGVWFPEKDSSCDEVGQIRVIVGGASGAGDFLYDSICVMPWTTGTEPSFSFGPEHPLGDVNNAPVNDMDTEYPSDDATGIQLNPYLNITVNDTDADTMNQTFRTNASGSWQILCWNNNTLNVSLSNTTSDYGDVFNQYETKYYISSNLSDGNGGWDNDTWSFTTEACTTCAVWHEESFGGSVTVTEPSRDISGMFPVDDSVDILTGIGNLSVNLTCSSDYNISLYDISWNLLTWTTGGAKTNETVYLDVVDELYFKFDTVFKWNVSLDSGALTKNFTFTTFNGSGFLYIENLTIEGNNNQSSGVYLDYPYVYFLTLYNSGDNIDINKYEIENMSMIFVDNGSIEIPLHTANSKDGITGESYIHTSNVYSDDIVKITAIEKSNLTELDYVIASSPHVFADFDVSSNGTHDRLHYMTNANPGSNLIYCVDFNGTDYNSECASVLTDQTVNNEKISAMGDFILVSNASGGLRLIDYNRTSSYDYASLDIYLGSYTDVTNDGNYFYAVSDTSLDIFSISGSDELVLEYSYVDSGMSVATFDDKSFIGSSDGGLLSYLYEGGEFIEQQSISMINNTGSVYEMEGADNYLVVAGEDGGIHLYGYELLRVAPPVIELIIAGDPGGDSVTRDGVIRYVNQSFNNQSFCNVTANISVPDYRTMGRYFKTTDDDIFIPSGNLSDDDTGYEHEGNHSLIACRYPCTFTGEYSQISAYIIGSGMSPPWVSYAIYNDSSGSPHTLLAFTQRDWAGSDVFTELERDLGTLYYPPCTRVWHTQDIAFDGNGASIDSIGLTEGEYYWLVFATNDSLGYTTYGYNYSNDIYWLLGNSLGDTNYVKTALYNISSDMNFSNVSSPVWVGYDSAHYACIYAIADSTYNDVPTVDISSATLHWYNDSVNTWNLSMSEMGDTNNWTFNVTGLDPDVWYTFDITAFDELADDVTFEHYRYLVEGQTERIEFQCNIPFEDESDHQGYNSSSTLYRNDSVLYLWNRTYGTDTWYGDDEHMEDALPHEQGVDGTADDTGGWESTLSGEVYQARHCLKFAGGWWDDNITIEDEVNLSNVYVHWWTAGGVNWDDARIHYGRMNTLYDFGWLELEGNVGTEWNFIELDTNDSTRASTVNNDIPDDFSDPSGVDNTIRLVCEHINLSQNIDDTTFDSSSIYNYFMGFDNNGSLSWTKESAGIINNRSYLSFIIFNIPSDIFTGVDNSTDTDSDGLPDFWEMNGTFTHPFLVDTDNDGQSDYYEYIYGSDPNNWSDTFSSSLSFSIVCSSGSGSDEFHFQDWTLGATGVGYTTQYNVSEDNQTGVIPALNITNTGNVPLNFTMYWTSNPGSGLSMKFATSDTAPNPGVSLIGVEVANETLIVSNLGIGSYEEIWLWMDFVSVSSGGDSVDVTITSSEYDIE